MRIKIIRRIKNIRVGLRRKMDIVMIAPSEIPARRANTLQVMKMAQALAIQGHQARLVAPTSQPLSRGPAPDNRLAWESLAHHYGLEHRFEVAWLYSNPRLKRYDFSWSAVRWAQHANETHPLGADLIYTRLPQAAALASWKGIPTILEIHDLPQGTVGPWLFRMFLSGKGARRLVVITQALANDLAGLLHPTQPAFGKRIKALAGASSLLQKLEQLMIIAPDGVDLRRYVDLPEPEQARRMLQTTSIQLAPERFTAGYTGHLYPGRGGSLLLKLAERIPEISFLIVGGEPAEVASFKREAEARGLKNLFLTGFVPNADLPLYQSACDILLMPYQQRVAASSGGDIARYLSPMKLFEYLACRRAIISSDLPALREIINSENAILAPPDQPEAWEQAIHTLKAQPDLRSRLANQARADAVQYTWEGRAQRIIAEKGHP